MQAHLIICHYIIWEEFTGRRERTPKVTESSDKVTSLLLPLWVMSKTVGSYNWLHLKIVRMKYLISYRYLNNLRHTWKRGRKDIQIRQRAFQFNHKLVYPIKPNPIDVKPITQNILKLIFLHQKAFTMQNVNETFRELIFMSKCQSSNYALAVDLKTPVN